MTSKGSPQYFQRLRLGQVAKVGHAVLVGGKQVLEAADRGPVDRALAGAAAATAATIECGERWPGRSAPSVSPVPSLGLIAAYTQWFHLPGHRKSGRENVGHAGPLSIPPRSTIGWTACVARANDASESRCVGVAWTVDTRIQDRRGLHP